MNEIYCWQHTLANYLSGNCSSMSPKHAKSVKPHSMFFFSIKIFDYTGNLFNLFWQTVQVPAMPDFDNSLRSGMDVKILPKISELRNTLCLIDEVKYEFWSLTKSSNCNSCAWPIVWFEIYSCSSWSCSNPYFTGLFFIYCLLKWFPK